MVARTGRREAPRGNLGPYRERMAQVIERVRRAELQIAQAKELEELDMGRTALQQALAEMQHLIRMAKRERGIELRSIEESESRYREMVRGFGGRAGAPRQGAATAEREG